LKKTLIVGIGSILCGDDGIGQRVIDELEKETLPENVRLHAGDISGLDLLKVFPDYQKIIIIDAADMKEDPGEVKTFDLSDIKESDFNDQFSTHGMALLETLTLARKLDISSEIKIIGIQPEDTSFKMDISKIVEKKIPEIIREIKNLINV
jgi:hydrogenase maturation protease